MAFAVTGLYTGIRLVWLRKCSLYLLHISPYEYATKLTCSMVKTTIKGKQRPELTNPNMNSGLNMVELNFFYYRYYDYYYKLVLLLHGWMHGSSHLRCLNSSELFCSASLTYWLLFPLTFGLWPFYYLGYNGFLDFLNRYLPSVPTITEQFYL